MCPCMIVLGELEVSKGLYEPKKTGNTYRASNSFKQPQTASKSHKETSKVSFFFIIKLRKVLLITIFDPESLLPDQR